MEEAQAELAEREVTGDAGGGMVKVTMTGRNDVRSVSVDPVLMEDREMLEDLIAAAVNDAVRRVERMREEQALKEQLTDVFDEYDDDADYFDGADVD